MEAQSVLHLIFNIATYVIYKLIGKMREGDLLLPDIVAYLINILINSGQA